MILDVGFTGTQSGMNSAQWEQLRLRLLELRRAGTLRLHHGDCVGADSQADWIARDCGLTVVVHPPLNPEKRAWCAGPEDSVREEQPYVVRNHDIVNECGLLIAGPDAGGERVRSGTWSTVRYARGVGVAVEVLVR